MAGAVIPRDEKIRRARVAGANGLRAGVTNSGLCDRNPKPGRQEDMQ